MLTEKKKEQQQQPKRDHDRDDDDDDEDDVFCLRDIEEYLLKKRKRYKYMKQLFALRVAVYDIQQNINILPPWNDNRHCDSRCNNVKKEGSKHENDLRINNINC